MKHEKTAEQVEEVITESKEETQKISRKNLLSTGSTLLNLACSDIAFGGFLKGKYYFIVGDSTSGKTFLSMTCFAEANHNRHFKDYRLIYDNVEDGNLINLENLFNEEVAGKIEPPKITEEGPRYSSTIEEFYYNIEDAFQAGKPFIYVLDSMDALTSEDEQDKFNENKTAFEKGKEGKGSYGDGKAKKNSTCLRTLMPRLRDTGSILIILSQTRDNIGGFGFGAEKKTRAGGHALKFYATLEIWSSIMGKIKKTIGGIERVIGVHVLLKVKKNRITGKDHEVEMDIYPSYGIDDIGSCIDYLIGEKYWEVSKQTISAGEFGFEGTRDKLISYIEDNKLEDETRAIVGKVWKTVEEACSLKRKKRYQSPVVEAQ